MTKSKRIIRSELRKAGAEKAEAQKLAQLAHSFPNIPKLSRSEKNEMLGGILPHQKYAVPYRSGLLTGGAVAILLALLVPNIVYSQPTDGVFYDIKRGAETVRSVIQPGFEPSESVRVRGRSDDHNSSHGKGSGESNDDSHRGGDDSTSDSDTGSFDSSGSPDSSNDSTKTDDASRSDNSSSSSGSGSAPDHNAARDACKAALDLRKKNGEDIDSDQYKSCDSL